MLCPGLLQKDEMAHTIKEFADVPTVTTVLTKLGLAICNLRALTSTTNGSGQTLLDLTLGMETAKNMYMRPLTNRLGSLKNSLDVASTWATT